MQPPTARLRLRIAPGAATTAIVGRHGDAWKIRVAAPPERGRANDAVLDILAATLDLARSAVRLVAGAGGRDKIVELTGLSAAEAEVRLEAACGKVRG